MPSDAMSLVAIAAVLNGLLIGVLLRDWLVRAKELKTLTDIRDNMNKNVQDFATAHNNVAAQVGKIQDKVNAHEIRLTGTMAGTVAAKA